MRTFTEIKTESDESGCSAKTLNDTCDLRACRVCLATNTKLFNLHEIQLAQSFGDLTGTPVSVTDGLPQHICNVCSSLLQKSAAFRIKCRQMHIFLQDARLQTPSITTEYLRSIDKTNVKPPLTTTHVLTLEFIPNKKEQEESGVEEERIKEEHFIELDEAGGFLDDEEDKKTIDEKVKLENDFTFKSNTKAYSLRETRKRKLDREETKVKRRKPPPKQVKMVKKVNLDIDTPEPEKIIKKPLRKKKRMFNSKTEEDFVSFSKTYDVEVVFLTREQQLQEVQSRKESKEYLNAHFQCHLCYEGFMCDGAYRKHMDKHNPGSGDHICDICHVRFPERYKLLNHQRRKHKAQFICRVCKHISKISTLAKMHSKWHEGFKFECQHCDKSFYKQSSYMNHVRENHSSVTCDVCQESVSGTMGLAVHKGKVHSEKNRCNTCGTQFHTEAALLRHFCEPGLRPCPQCGDSFPNVELLHEHLETLHKNRRFKCDQCNKMYSNERQLSTHWTRAHKGQSPPQALQQSPRSRQASVYMCEVCAKSFSSEATLRYHQRIHTDERPYPCPTCPKRFRLKSHMQVHTNIHTGARPFKCPICPEGFKSHSQKHKHYMLVHTKERPFKCTMCEKTYVISSDLKLHVRTVHLKIPLPPRKRRRKPPAQHPAPAPPLC